MGHSQTGITPLGKTLLSSDTSSLFLSPTNPSVTSSSVVISSTQTIVLSVPKGAFITWGTHPSIYLQVPGPSLIQWPFHLAPWPHPHSEHPSDLFRLWNLNLSPSQAEPVRYIFILLLSPPPFHLISNFPQIILSCDFWIIVHSQIWSNWPPRRAITPCLYHFLSSAF